MMQVRAWSVTDLGNVRENNEDSFLVDNENNIYIVADGVGGSEAGEVASGHLVQRVSENAARLHALVKGCDPVGNKDDRERVFSELLDLIQQINGEVFEIGKEINPNNPSATTCDVLLLTDNAAFIAHVGDSRVYLFRGDEVFRITEDHTFAEQLKRENVTDERVIDKFRNVLTRSIGGKPQVDIDALFIDLQVGDRVMMCSDGVTDYLSGPEILEYATRLNGQEMLNALVQEAKDRGGHDNITAVMISLDGRIERPTPTRDQSLDTLRQADILGQISLFEGLSLRELIKVLRIVYERTYQDGEVIMEPGTDGESLFIVGDGEVELTVGGETRTLEMGRHFGELALIQRGKRQSRAVAKGEALMLVVPAEKFRDIVTSDPSVGNTLLWNLLASLAKEMQEIRGRES
ncbi:MAG: cyclic nucleotide-binding domain-containing protein [bacterium]